MPAADSERKVPAPAKPELPGDAATKTGAKAVAAAPKEVQVKDAHPKDAQPPATQQPARTTAHAAPLDSPAEKAAHGELSAPRALPAASLERVAARPSLDLPTLEKRVRDTNVIGVMSKFALKNQIDDLVDKFRKAHESGAGKVSALRQPFDTLLSKVQSLLSDDPVLAGEVRASREPLWRILSDPAKFRNMS